jgi:hypothetical protein
MKTRAELMRERAEKAKAAGAVEAPKAPGPKMVFDCKPCGATCVAAECTVRSNGHLECLECGAPHRPDDLRPAGQVPPLEPSKKPTHAQTTAELAKREEQKQEQREADKAARNPTPPDKFCGACGQKLTWAAGVATYFFGCGHNKADHGIVDAPPAAAHVESIQRGGAIGLGEQGPIHPASAAPEFTAPLVKLNVQWGKSRMPIDRFNAFEVGGFSITVDLHPHEDRVATAQRLLSDLEKIAEEAFRRQHEWYIKKLSKLGVDGD